MSNTANPTVDAKPDLTLTLTTAEYAAAIARLSALPGVELTETKFSDHISGIIRYKAVRVGYRYRDGELELTVLMVPVLATKKYVVGKIQEWLQVEAGKVAVMKSKKS